MVYVYSTATATIDYVEYNKPSDKNMLPQVIRKVTIKGGANVADKHLFTPNGVVTEVTPEDYAFLAQNQSFIQHVTDGFHVVEKTRFDVDSVVNDMEPKDRSAPLTPEDYEPGGRMHDANAENPIKAPKTVKVAA